MDRDQTRAQSRPDDVLQRIDEALERLFPPDPTLDDDAVESILLDEIDEWDGYEDEDENGEDLDEDDPFGLHEVAASCDRDDRNFVYGVCGDEVVFVVRCLAESIDEALPLIKSGGIDWETAVPWVDAQQADVLPEELVAEFGTGVATALDGPRVSFHATDTDAIVRAARRLRRRCVRDDALVARVRGVIC